MYGYTYLLGDLCHSEWRQHHHIHLPDIVKGYCTVVFSGEHWIPRCNSVRPNGAHIRWRMMNWTTICETHSLGNTTLSFLSFVWISLSQVAYTAQKTTIQLISLHNCIPMLKKVLELNVIISLQWRHNDHDIVSNHQPHGCLLTRLFRRRSKKTSKLRVTGLCVGNSPGPVNSRHKGPVTRKMFPFDDVIMYNTGLSSCQTENTMQLILCLLI